MPEKFIRLSEVAAMLGCGTTRAAKIMRESGVNPVDLGRGRSGGLRWLESAVRSTMLKLHANAQQPEPTTKKTKVPSLHLAGMSAKQLFSYLENARTVQ